MAPPMTARSVALSLLLGSRPPRLAARDLVRMGESFGVAAPSMRVALSRMTAAGELTSVDSCYALADRHLERHRTTEERISPRLRPYDGRWTMAVVVGRGRAADARSALRLDLAERRFGELREGVWLRPDNLEAPPPDDEDLEILSARPQRPVALARAVWDLPTWAGEAQILLDALDGDADPAVRFKAAAATVRHLRTDPALPPELAPGGWPAERLRAAYETYRADLSGIGRDDPDHDREKEPA
ncbi:PaaX domain-containing protein, C- domain protein [Mumia flava]|nr:PaaX domain-containing protein, C- domain protein [Mumia flava]